MCVRWQAPTSPSLKTCFCCAMLLTQNKVSSLVCMCMTFVIGLTTYFSVPCAYEEEARYIYVFFFIYMASPNIAIAFKSTFKLHAIPLSDSCAAGGLDKRVGPVSDQLFRHGCQRHWCGQDATSLLYHCESHPHHPPHTPPFSTIDTPDFVSLLLPCLCTCISTFPFLPHVHTHTQSYDQGVWLVCFSSEYELGKFESALATTWKEQFQVSWDHLYAMLGTVYICEHTTVPIPRPFTCTNKPN